MSFSVVLLCASFREQPAVKNHKLHECACPMLQELRESGLPRYGIARLIAEKLIALSRYCQNTDTQNELELENRIPGRSHGAWPSEHMFLRPF